MGRRRKSDCTPGNPQNNLHSIHDYLDYIRILDGILEYNKAAQRINRTKGKLPGSERERERKE